MRPLHWLAIGIALLLAGCSGRHAALTPLTPPPVLGLGSPRDLAKHASFADASQVRYGTEFDPTIPHANATITPPHSLTLRPSAGPPLSPAWAVYSFDLTGYDE